MLDWTPSTGDPTTSTAESLARGTARVLLICYHPDDSQICELQPDVPVVLGRARHADIHVEEITLSRRHARLTLREQGVLVEDLGSHNGVLVDGARVSSAIVAPGQELKLGDVTVFIHYEVSCETAKARLERHEDFCARFGHELLRARATSDCVALIYLRSLDARRAHVGRFWQHVRAWLEPSDAMTLYSPEAMLALVPAKSARVARERAQKIIASEPQLVCGVALFPEHGTSYEALLGAAHASVQRASLEKRLVCTERAPARAEPGAVIVAESPALKELLGEAERLAAIDLPVLVLGESGSGKEILARALHETGPRRTGPFCALNCAGMPSGLIESTLFGHVRGAFTGADRNAEGLLRAAHGGTLLLDEVAELSPTAQASLLRVLETKLVTPVGSTKAFAVDVRIVSATHADLQALVAAGQFRLDLFYRFAAITLRLPPLRSRPEDIDALTTLFVERACARWGRARPQLSAELRSTLRAYAWPGNVRELRNVLERALAISRTTRLEVAQLPEYVRAGAMSAHERASCEAAPDGVTSDRPLSERLAEYEAAAIRQALHACAGNRTLTAAKLGMPLRTLMRKLERYQLR